MREYIEYLLSIPKSFYFNLSVLPFRQAIRLPVFIRYNCKIKSAKGKIVFKNAIRRGIVKIGFGNVGVFDKKYSRSIVELKGAVVFESKATFGHGTKISVGPKATLTIGDNFTNTAEITIICFKDMSFGKNVLTSWNTLIMDTDFHATYHIQTNQTFSYEEPVRIGNNVWIGTRAVVLKGSCVPDGCIVGANALVNKKYEEENCLLAGNPTKICKRGISLKR